MRGALIAMFALMTCHSCTSNAATLTTFHNGIVDIVLMDDACPDDPSAKMWEMRGAIDQRTVDMGCWKIVGNKIRHRDIDGVVGYWPANLAMSYQQLDIACRGGHGDDPLTQRACHQRDSLAHGSEKR